MNYFKYTFSFDEAELSGELIIAYLSEFCFESFVQEDNFIEAYLPENESINVDQLKSVLSDINASIDFHKELIEDQNWNAKWETDYPVVTVGEDLIVRAPFHQLSKAYAYDILIQPKMSFGTGHHETTYLMLKFLLAADIANKRVLDMGSGTGVLSIAAHKMDAHFVYAVDIEDWAYENTIENIELNSAHVDVNKGDVSSIKGLSFDIILANINKNVLLSDIKAYSESLVTEGSLYLSGFFGTDVDDITDRANDCGLRLKSVNEKSTWAAMHLIKTS